MAFDHRIFRNKDGIGMPSDPLATDSTSDWTAVALLKGLYNLLGGTGITVAGVSTAAKQDTGNASLTSIDGHVDGLETLVTSTNTKLDTLHADLGSVNLNTDTLEALTGIVTETAPASDTASSGLNGRLQRIAQRLTSLIALVPASIGAKAAAGSLSVTTATDDNTLALFGAVTETAPASDTASSGLNGRLQRIAQRITSLIALIPASLGQKTMSASFAVTIASDQSAVTTVIAAATNASTTAYATSLVIKASAGTLYGLSGYNSKASVQFIQLHDATSLPADTAVPKIVFTAQPSSPFAIDFGQRGRAFGTGIVICNSSTGPTKTVGSADIWVDAQYV